MVDWLEQPVGHPHRGVAAAAHPRTRLPDLADAARRAGLAQHPARRVPRAGGVTYRPILSYYAGGNALNAILPASAGTVAMLGFFRTTIAGATVSGLVGATAVENIFFAVVAVLIYGYLFLTAAGSFDFKFGWFADHWRLTILRSWRSRSSSSTVRVSLEADPEQWENAKEGGAILGEPRKFLVQVVGVEALSYIARMGVNATFMKAFHIPVSLENVFLIVAASSISSTDRDRTRRGRRADGTRDDRPAGVAPPSAISAYAIGQQIITTAWNVTFGFILLAREIGWKQTRGLVHFRKKKATDDEDAADPADARRRGSAGPVDHYTENPLIASPTSLAPITRHRTAITTALLWIIHALSRSSTSAARAPIAKYMTTGMATPTAAMRVKISQTTACSPPEMPVSASAAAAPMITSRFFGLATLSATPAPSALTGVNASTAPIHFGVGTSSCWPGRALH